MCVYICICSYIGCCQTHTPPTTYAESKTGASSPSSVISDIQQRKNHWRRSVLNSLGNLSPNESTNEAADGRRDRSAAANVEGAGG